MSQLIRKPPGQEPVGRPPETPSDAEPPYRWRTFFIWAAGLAIIFGVLFALRGLHIFPRPVGDDPEIVAAKATQQALMTAAVLTPRPTAAPTRAPAVAPTTQPATRATTAPTSGPAVAPITQPTVGALAASTPQPVNTPARLGAPASDTAAPIGGVGGVVVPEPTGATLSAGSAQELPTPAQAIDPALAAQVLQAYQSYWTVRVHAMAEPTSTDIDLGSVMADVELTTAQKTLADYRSEGKAYRTSVEHHAQPMSITASEAVIVDEYVGTSVKLDPETGEPLAGEPTVEQYKDVFVLRPVGGVWKVVDEHAEG